MKNRASHGYVYYLAIIMSLIGISTTFMQNGENSLFLRGAVFLIGIFFVMSLAKSGGHFRKSDFLIILAILSSIYIIFVKLFYYGNFLLIGPLMGIACFMIIASIIVYKYTFCFPLYCIINNVGATILIIAIFTKSTDMWGAVQIGTMNPQTIASWALIFGIGAVILLDYFIEKITYKLLFVISQMLVYGFMLYITIITEGRFSTVILIILLLLRILPPLKVFDNKWIRLVFAFSPIIILIMTEIFYSFDWFQSMSGGSLLNGRERIWAIWMSKTFETPLFGVNYKYINANSFYSHSIVVDYSVMFGVYTMMIFWIALAYIFLKKVPYFSNSNKKVSSSYNRLKYDAFLAFLFLLVGSSCEGCFFSVGGGGIFVFTFIPLLISMSNEGKCSKKGRKKKYA